MAVEESPTGLSLIGPGVFRANETITFLSETDLKWLKMQAGETEQKRARICLHKSNDDPVHEMVIAVHKSSYIPPHLHPDKEESFLLIEGTCDILLFNEDGMIKERVMLDPRSESDKHYFYRIGKNVCHTIKLYSDWLIFHEVTKGPFSAEANVIPGWVPEFASADEGVFWISQL